MSRRSGWQSTTPNGLSKLNFRISRFGASRSKTSQTCRTNSVCALALSESAFLNRNTHPLGPLGVSDAVAAGEGFIRRFVSYPMENRLPSPGLRARLSRRESIDRNGLISRSSFQHTLSGTRSIYIKEPMSGLLHETMTYNCQTTIKNPRGMTQ